MDLNTSYALELVVIDMAGPVTPSNLGGASYFLGILDVFTRHSWVFTKKIKSDAVAKIMEWKCVAEGQAKTKLLKLRSDNGGDFTFAAFKSSMATGSSSTAVTDRISVSEMDSAMRHAALL